MYSTFSKLPILAVLGGLSLILTGCTNSPAPTTPKEITQPADDETGKLVDDIPANDAGSQRDNKNTGTQRNTDTDNVPKLSGKPAPAPVFQLTETQHSYTQQDLGFTRFYQKANFPFVGGSIIDSDDDGLNEIFITGEAGSKDVMYRYVDGAFIDIIDSTGIDNTQDSFGSLALDNDGDGDTDLLVAREQGLYYYENSDGTFTETLLDVSFPADTVPVDISPGDVDNDGDIDLYISTFISVAKFKLVTFNDPNHKKPNLLLINQGNGTYIDETDQRGLTYAQNTFTAVFADIDNNGRLDLISSPNTDVMRIWMNENGQFSEVSSPTQYGFWMGMAVQDIDHDGDLDILSSNSGTSIPQRVLKGDSTSDQPIDPSFAYILNDGNGNLSQSLTQLNPSDIGFSRGVVNTDLDSDMLRDILITQNNIKRPPHKLSKLPGETLIYNSPHNYTRKGSDLGLNNKKFGFSILYGDVNGDYLQDIIYLNLDAPSVVALHQTSDPIATTVVKTPRDLSWYGNRIQLTFDDGTKYEEYYMPKQGLMGSQSPDMIFPMGNYDTATIRVIEPHTDKVISEQQIHAN